MRLKWKIGISIFAVVVFATVVNLCVLGWFFLPSFTELDRHEATANGARAYQYFQDEADHLQTLTRGWARRGDTYQFAGDFNNSYRDANLSPENLTFLSMAAFAVVDNDGVVTFATAPKPEIARLFQVGKALPAGLFKQLDVGKGAPPSAEGMVKTPLGPLLESIAPIWSPGQDRPERGYIVFARLIGPRLTQLIRDTASLDFTLMPYRGSAGTASGPSLTEQTDTLSAKYTLTDVSGTPSYTLDVVSPRQFSELGRWAVRGAMARFVVFTMIFLGCTSWLIGRLVAKPLAKMANRMSEIAETGDLDQPLDIQRTDEIGWVADVFNRMISELKSARGRLVEQSYSTGMADLAAGILNNVRTAVDPVVEANQSAERLLDKVDTTTLQEVGRELAYTKIDQDRRQKLGVYVNAFTEGTRRRLGEIKDQIERIGRGMDHIRNILEDHESISRWPRQSATIDCRRLVEEAAYGISGVGGMPIDIEVSAVDGDVPLVTGHSFILRQVIGNLLANAVDAIQHAGRKRGRIHVLTRKAELKGKPAVEIVVGDNGAGFTAMQAERLFERGYSTRSDRPGGFGLFWCRDALAAMNATITAQSPGPGLGATFRVFLPVAEIESAPVSEPAVVSGAA